MSYDPKQRLYQVGSATTNIRFLYDGADAIGEYDANGNVLRRSDKLPLAINLI
jgi:hypothetical protein